MDATKPYEFIRFRAMDATKPYEFIGFGAQTHKNQSQINNNYPPNSPPNPPKDTLRYAIMLPGRKSAFRAGFQPDCYRENTEIGPPAGRRPAQGRFRCFPGSSPAQIRPGRPISGPEALLRNIEYPWEGLGGSLGVVVVDA
jgi:hypothetical protein